MEAVAVVVLSLLGIASLVERYRSRDARIRRALRRAPLITTAGFSEHALAKLEGRIRYCKEPLRAPLSDLPCAYYEVVVEESGGGSEGRGLGAWKPIIVERAGQDFVLEDAAGTALVRMDHAQVSVVRSAHFRTGTWRDASATLERFLSRHGESSKGIIFNRDLRYSEGVLEEGEFVAVYGRGFREPDPDPRATTGGYRDMAIRLVVQGSPERPIYVSDDWRVFSAKPSRRTQPPRQLAAKGLGRAAERVDDLPKP